MNACLCVSHLWLTLMSCCLRCPNSSFVTQPITFLGSFLVAFNTASKYSTSPSSFCNKTPWKCLYHFTCVLSNKDQISPAVQQYTAASWSRAELHPRWLCLDLIRWQLKGRCRKQILWGNQLLSHWLLSPTYELTTRVTLCSGRMPYVCTSLSLLTLGSSGSSSLIFCTTTAWHASMPVGSDALSSYTIRGGKLGSGINLKGGRLE